MGQVHGGRLLGQHTHPAVLLAAGVGGEHLGLVAAVLREERVHGLVPHGGGQHVRGVVLAELREWRVSVGGGPGVIFFIRVIILVILLVGQYRKC